jgi:hypothetical protein
MAGDVIESDDTLREMGAGAEGTADIAGDEDAMMEGESAAARRGGSRSPKKAGSTRKAGGPAKRGGARKRGASGRKRSGARKGRRKR